MLTARHKDVQLGQFNVVVRSGASGGLWLSRDRRQMFSSFPPTLLRHSRLARCRQGGDFGCFLIAKL